MGPLVGATELSKALVEAGNNLLKPHSSTDATLTLLDDIESLLSTVEQDPIESVQNALMSPMNALVSADLLRNPDSDVRVSVISCLTEIMRITAPEAPYNDNHMKDIFQVTIEVFGKLADTSCRSYKKVEGVLETVSKVRSSLVMLDLECDDLVLEMFRQFLKIISPDHPQIVLLSMETIMITVIDESEEVPMDLLEILLSTVKKETQDVSPAALKLVEKVLSSCACKLQPSIMEALESSGTSLDMYSPVVSSICQSESATTQAHNDVKAKENEADEKISEENVVPSDSLEDKLNMGLSRKGNRSKRTARSGTRQANGDDKVKSGNNLKQGQSECTDAETESGSTRKRGRRKPNFLMNPEEGYSFKMSSSKKVQEKGLSVGKGAANKASLPTKVGQTNQSVVISLSPSGKARTGSHKRSRTQMEERKYDEPTSKKQIVKKGNHEEDDLMESNLEKPEDGSKTAKSSKKEKTQNGLAKTSLKKQLAETKMVKGSGKKLVHPDAKKKNSAGASMNTPSSRSSKSKMNSRATTSATKKSVQTSRSQPKRKRTAGEEVESNIKELGEEMVGKRVKVWWSLDKMFYEGVVDSYCSLKKKHKIEYMDGDEEELNLNKERFVVIQDNSSAIENLKQDEEIDLPESVPLSELFQIQKSKKRKNVSKNVQPSSSPEVRSSTRTMKKKYEEDEKPTEGNVEEKKAAMSEAKLQEEGSERNWY